MFQTLEDIKTFLGEDSSIQEAWELVELLPYYELEGSFQDY